MDFVSIEKKWQERWRKDKIFEPRIGGKKFFFTVPFPYTSGPPHIGHGRTFTIGDFIARFKRKLGFNVLWPMGFHRSGTPILAISDRIRRGDKDYIKLFSNYVALKESNPKKVKEIIESFKNPENVADFFAGMLMDGFNEIGLSIDWSRRFKTGESLFNKFVEWQYLRFRDKGVIIQDNHPVTYCLNCQNAVGEDDIKDGDVSKVSINEFSAIKFKLGNEFLVASTLRPETIFGVTNLWVNPNALYVKVIVNNEVLIMSSQAFEKLSYQMNNVKRVGEISGNELLGKSVVTPIGSEVPVLPGLFVDADVATGIVYSVPAHAPFDYVALRDLQSNKSLVESYGLNYELINKIKPITIINIEGYNKEPAISVVESLGIKSQRDAELIEEATKKVYKDEFYKGVLNELCNEFAGLKIKEVKDKVFNKLVSKNLAFTFYETSRKAVCRCTGKIIVAVLNNQWFIDYSSKKWKDTTRGLINSLTIIPEKYRKSFLDTLDWLDKRPCARKRGIGTKLPFDKEWVIESLSDSTIYMAFYTINGIIRREGITPSQLTPELFDYVFLGKGDPSKLPVKESIVKEMREQFTYWYPNDHRHTAPAHISNHLSFFLMHHTLLFPKKYWPKVLTFSGLLIREGVKMSKSKGNVIPLVDISRKYSADLFRLYILSSSDIDSVVDWRENEVESVKNKLINFANIALNAVKAKPATKLLSIDKWIISRFYSRLRESKNFGNKMMIRDYAVSLFFKFFNELSYYRKRVDAKHFNSVLRTFIGDWVIALEPLIPHICEEIWSYISDDYVSLQLFPKIKSELINEEIEFLESVVRRTISDVNELLKLIKFKPKKVSLFVADEWKFDLFKSIIGGGSIKDLMSKALSIKSVKNHSKEASKIIQSIVKNHSFPSIVSTRDKEYNILNDAIKFFEDEFGIEFDVVKDSTNPKALTALPGKPGILIE